jgi:hypothetical protein
MGLTASSSIRGRRCSSLGGEETGRDHLGYPIPVETPGTAALHVGQPGVRPATSRGEGMPGYQPAVVGSNWTKTVLATQVVAVASRSAFANTTYVSPGAGAGGARHYDGWVQSARFCTNCQPKRPLMHRCPWLTSSSPAVVSYRRGGGEQARHVEQGSLPEASPRPAVAAPSLE